MTATNPFLLTRSHLPQAKGKLSGTHYIWASLIACTFVCFAPAAELIKLEPFQAPNAPTFKPVLLADLPDIMVEVSKTEVSGGKVNANGLVATINYDRIVPPKSKVKEQKWKLDKKATGFRGEMKVRVQLQSGRAPLAVLLVGFSSPANDTLARTWQAHLYEAGCHVLSFDSVIRNTMNRVSNHGVAGNFIAEGKVIASIVQASLDHKTEKGGTLKERTSSVRLLGTSWGGLLAQQVLRQPGAKTWPIDRCLLISTPVDIRTAAKLLDKYHREDKAKFKIADLARLVKKSGYVPKAAVPTAEEASIMRAGIGWAFHGDLTSIAKSNIERYRKELPPELKKLMQNEDWHLTVNNWDFFNYIFQLGRPYWKIKDGYYFPTSLPRLLEGCPNFVQAFVAKDDPLCTPEQLKAVATQLKVPRLQILPHGGHLGYTGTRWTRALVLKYFKP